MARVNFYDENDNVSSTRIFSSIPAAENFLISLSCSGIEFSAKIEEDDK